METQKDTITAQDLFSFEVNPAINRAMNQLEETFDSVNLDFEDEITLTARKHAMSHEQIEKVLADRAGKWTEIFHGTRNVVDALQTAYCDVLGEENASRIFKRVVAEGQKAMSKEEHKNE
jgi:hypothetical protein